MSVAEWRGPLDGLRVIDLSTEIAGPYAAKLWVDAGAEVIKVELTGQTAPDPLRRWTASGQALAPAEDGALFQHLNASKRGVEFDLENDQQRASLLRLGSRADLVIESFAAGERSRLGLDLSVWQAVNPALSLVSITPWGQSGPWARRPATEFTLQAATGSTDYRGLPTREPVAAGGRIGEWAAGSFAALGGLLAWLGARRCGRGQHVDVSIFEAMLVCMTHYHDLAGQWREGALARAVEVPSIEPARDGWVGLCTLTGQQWKDFCVMIERPDLGEDERFLDGMFRSDRIDFIQQAVHAWTLEHDVAEIVELAGLFRIPVAPIGDGRNLPRCDHFRQRGVFVGGPGGFLRPRPPWLLEKTAPRPFGTAPKAGDREGAQGWAGAGAQRPAAGPAAGVSLPLAGLEVIELSTFWAGPIAGGLLADMGADVLKIESIQRPDGMRFAGAIPGEKMWEWSPIFHGVNTGKRELTLQLDSDEGRALLERLIARADVLIENFSVRVMDHFGLGWEHLHALNPRLILVRMPAFGLDGPWRDRPGFAMTVEQASGLAWITGYEDLPLVMRGVCDPVGGMNAAFALLLALEERERSGEGQLVEVPLVETALNLAAEQVIEYSAYGELLSRAGNRGPYATPQGVYRCSGEDAFVALAVASDAQWRALCRVLGDPAWAREPALEQARGRRRAQDEIDAHLLQWFSARERDEVAERLMAAGIPAQALVNAHFLMPQPQLEARGFFQWMEHPVTGRTRYPGWPMAFSALPRALHQRPPPTLGEHNDEILRERLGLDDDEIQRLYERKIVGRHPAFL